MKTFPAKRLFAVLCLLAGVAAIGVTAWNWRQSTRPGRVHFERGLDDAASQQIAQAEQEWLTGVRQDPSFPDNHTQLGDLYAARGRFPEAAACYEAAARLVPGDGTVWLRMARADEAAGRHQAALDAAKRAAARRPNDAETQEYFGILAARLNQPALAQPALMRAHTLSPSNADVLIYLVRVELQRNDLTAAERDLTPFLAQNQNNAEACFLMASLLHRKPPDALTLQKALGYARQAQAGAPNNVEANILLGQLFLDAGQAAQGLPAFGRALSVSPNSISGLHGLLTCDMRLHRTADAAQTQQKLNMALARWVRMGHVSDLLLANPADTEAMLEMARLREENGEPALALSYYREAARQAPHNAHAQAALNGFLRRNVGRHTSPLLGHPPENNETD